MMNNNHDHENNKCIWNRSHEMKVGESHPCTCGNILKMKKVITAISNINNEIEGLKSRLGALQTRVEYLKELVEELKV